MKVAFIVSKFPCYDEAFILREIYALSEEHGHVDFSACELKPEIGERVTVIPNHCCTVTSLFDEVVGARGDQVEVAWHVAARCAVR